MVVRFDGSAGSRHLGVCPSSTIPLDKRVLDICVVLSRKKSSAYDSDYVSGFLQPAALHLPALIRLAKTTDNAHMESFVRRCDGYASIRLGSVTARNSGADDVWRREHNASRPHREVGV